MVSEISNKASKVMAGRTGTLDEAAELLRTIAGSRRADESIKGVLWRVGRQLKGWSTSRVRAVWYRDSRVHLRAEEFEQLRSLAQPKPAAAPSAEDELADLRLIVSRLARYEPLLERLDAEMFSPELSAARDQLGQARRLLGTDGV